MGQSIYLANSTNATAYSHSHEAVSDRQNQSPNQLNQTPAGIISAGTNLPTPTKDLISVDDLSGIQISVTPANPGQSTVRANLLWKLPVTETEAYLTKFISIAKYSHRVTDGLGADRDPIYTYRLYLWDFTLTTWVQIDTNTGQTAQELSSTLTANLSNYIESSIAYLLIWDYEGVYVVSAAGGGGKNDDEIVGP